MSTLDEKIELTPRKVLLGAAGAAVEIGVLALVFESNVVVQVATAVFGIFVFAALAARSRFMDLSGLPALCWSARGSPEQSCDSRTRFLNRTLAEEKNLSALIEQIAVYSP